MRRETQTHEATRPRSRRYDSVGLSWVASSGSLCFLMVGVVSLIASGCGSGTDADVAKKPEAAPQPAVVTARLETWPRLVHVQGTLEADDQVVVGAKVAGRVEQVSVEIGSRVQKDKTVLATLDVRDLRLREQQAEAQLAQACAKLGLKPADDETKLNPAELPAVREAASLRAQAQENWKRAQDIRVNQKEAITDEEFEERKAAWEVARAKHDAAINDAREQIALVGVRRAELGLAKQVLEDARILAPFDGIVKQRYVAPGAYLQVGQQVVSLVRTDKVRFRAGVPEREAVLVREGQKVDLKIEGQPAPYHAAVSRIAPALDPANRSLTVEADLPNPELRLRAGLFAEGDIAVDPDAKTLAVPAAAVSEFAGVEKVWLVRSGKAEPRRIETGRHDGSRVEILTGLSAGDVVAADAGKMARGG